MPLIKVISADNGSGDEGQKSDNSSLGGALSGQDQKSQGANTQSNNLFDARTTALFYKGKLVDTLSPEQTLCFNTFNKRISGTNIAINDVVVGEKKYNYLLTVISDTHFFKVKATDTDVNLEFNLSMFCKVSDVLGTDLEDSLSSITTIPKPLIEKTEKMLSNSIMELVNKSVSSGCDFLNIKERLYRYNYSKYSQYKDNFLSKLKVKIKVNVRGQR